MYIKKDFILATPQQSSKARAEALARAQARAELKASAVA